VKTLHSIFCLLLALSTSSLSSEEMLHFDTDNQRVLFKQLTHEYRCLKCQNQTLASSNADLAGDLRHEIHEMVLANKSREEIDSYLLQRYGDFVLYKPRLKASTLLLWFGPFLLLFLALWFALKTAKARNPSEREFDKSQLEKARSLLNLAQQ